MEKNMREFLFNLLRFKTYAGNSSELEKCAKYIKSYAESLGLDAEIVYDNVPNVIIKREGKGKRISFVSHYDVVPPGEGWKTDPFVPYFSDGKIYGRGACDDKGHIVSTLFALASAEELEINPLIAIAGGEETQVCGDFFKEIAKKTDIAIVTDTGPMDEVHIGASGFLGFKIKIKGKQGHSAYDYSFDDPILKLDTVIRKLKDISEYARKNFVSKYSGRAYEHVPVRIYPTIIESKPSVINIVPSVVEVLVNIRTVPEWDNSYVEEYFLNAWDEFPYVEIEKHPLELIPWVNETTESHRFADIVESFIGRKPKIGIMPGGSDGVHFFKEGCSVIEYGFCSEKCNIHAPNEYVKWSDVELLYKILKYVMEKGLK